MGWCFAKSLILFRFAGRCWRPGRRARTYNFLSVAIALREKREWAARKMEHNEETPNPPGKETWRPEQKYYEREYYEHNYHTPVEYVIVFRQT